MEITSINFNPHSPCGERPSARHPSGQLCGNFNPHSPCGERPGWTYVRRMGRGISIHTPHAGSDVALTGFFLLRFRFQSTLPMRGATSVYKSICSGRSISIHTPHAGSDDFTACRYYDKVAISIHTPHAGSDSYTRGEYYGYQDFNPHSPCGERH